MANKIFNLVLRVTSKLNDGEGGTVLEINAYIRETQNIRKSDKELNSAIRDSLKKAFVKGTVKQDICTKRYYVINHDQQLPKKIPGKKQSKAGSNKGSNIQKQKMQPSKVASVASPEEYMECDQYIMDNVGSDNSDYECSD